MSQGTQIRAYSNLTAGWSFSGAAPGTITHVAGVRVLFPDADNSGLTITNNYGLLINNQTANTGSITYTNRWGIYQEGTSDLNYLAANLLLGSTTNSGEKLQVTGNAKITGNLGVGVTPTNKLDILGSGGTIAQFKDSTTYCGVVIDSNSSSTPFTRYSSSGTGIIMLVLMIPVRLCQYSQEIMSGLALLHQTTY
jgi:hypothetical protein